jgi:hypothetical protein
MRLDLEDLTDLGATDWWSLPSPRMWSNWSAIVQVGAKGEGQRATFSVGSYDGEEGQNEQKVSVHISARETFQVELCEERGDIGE